MTNTTLHLRTDDAVQSVNMATSTVLWLKQFNAFHYSKLNKLKIENNFTNIKHKITGEFTKQQKQTHCFIFYSTTCIWLQKRTENTKAFKIRPRPQASDTCNTAPTVWADLTLGCVFSQKNAKQF